MFKGRDEVFEIQKLASYSINRKNACKIKMGTLIWKS